MACPICQKRKPKRSCPAKGARICSFCCGTEREVSIDCPLDCSYLRENREREYVGHLSPKNFPFKDVSVDEHFLEEHNGLLSGLARGTLKSTLAVPGAADADAQQALEALIQTYKTLESGIHYERRPDSTYGRAVFDGLREVIAEFQRHEVEQAGFNRTRDGDILATLVFLYRMALDRDNRKPKGKAFLDFLEQHFQVAAQPGANLIIPAR